MKPRLAQVHPSGATDGQVAVYDAAAGYWKPGNPATVTVCRTTFTAVGGESVAYLGDVPVANSEQVYVAGVYRHPGVDYTLSGTTLVLTTPATTGQHVTVSYIGPSTVCHVTTLVTLPHVGFKRPTPLTRPVRRFHRIR